ncbi:MAG: hypothetical protein JXP34_01720 [Planctomycetes bacterium]|nr:hypothetical protein [Planctomycetota bacterium]
MAVLKRSAWIGLAFVLAAGTAWADEWDDLAGRLVATQMDAPATSPQAASWGYSTSSTLIDVDYAAGMTAQGLLVYYNSRDGAANLTACRKAGEYIVQILCPRTDGVFSSDVYFLAALAQDDPDSTLAAKWLATVNCQLDRYDSYPLSGVISWYLANPTSPNLAAYDIAYIAVGAYLSGHATAGAWRTALISAVGQLTGGTTTFQTLGLACSVWGLEATGGMPAGTIPSGYFAGKTYASLPGELAALQEGYNPISGQPDIPTSTQFWFFSNFDKTGCPFTQDAAFAIRALELVDPILYAMAIQKARAAIENKVLANGDLDSSLHVEGPLVYEPGVMGEALAAMPFVPPVCNGCFTRGDANNDNAVDIGDVTTMLDNLFNGVPSDCWDSVDANDDNELDISDPVRVLNWIFLSGPALPAPFPPPVYGPDTTPDVVGPYYIPACTRVKP